MFQFQIGSIKNEDVDNCFALIIVFQFQIGSIKNGKLSGKSVSGCVMFQFQIGSIKKIWYETV